VLGPYFLKITVSHILGDAAIFTSQGLWYPFSEAESTSGAILAANKFFHFLNLNQSHSAGNPAHDPHSSLGRQ